MAWRPSIPRLYRVLLLAYPAEFRQEYGDEMQQLLADRLHDESPISLWFAMLADVARTAPREHLHILLRDLQHFVRLLRNSPGFAATTLLVLSLGIGSAVTVFSVINAVLIRTLPYGEAERLVYLWTPLPRYENLPRELGPSFADVLAWRATSRSLTDITALRQRTVTLNAGGDSIRIGAAIVLGNFFRTLKSAALLGRPIDDNDDRPGQERVAVISFPLWRSQFNQDAGVVGKTVRLAGIPYRIVGVMPAGFEYPHENDFPLQYAALARTEIWIPASLTPQQEADRMETADAAIGRLRPGVSLQQAQSELSAIEKGLDPLNLPEMRGMQSLIVPFIETAVGPVRPLLRLLAGAVILVLLIACANVANLLMARAAGRVHELGVRAALGAPRMRLARQLFSESLLLSVIGGALGVGMAFVAVKILVALNPGDIPRFTEISLDLRVLAFALVVSLASGTVFGILPSLAASRIGPAELCRQGGGRGLTGGSPLVRNVLIVADVALAVILLAGAGLLIRSYLRVQGEETGFAPSTLTMKLSTDRGARTSQELAALWQRATERIAALPGVIAVGGTNVLPLAHGESTSTFRVEGYPNRANQTAQWRRVLGDYFQAMQTRLIAGRFLNGGDLPVRPSAVPRGVVVSESFAKLYFPQGNAVGGRLQRGEPSDSWSTIVGVVADVRHSSLEQSPRPALYEPSWSADALAVRTALPPETMIASVRKALHESDAGFALSDIQTMRDRTSEASARRRFQTVLLAAFAAVAVFLALIGLQGLLSYTVRQRTAEIGIRIALGAGPRAVVGMVVGRGLMLTCAGLALGLAAAATLGHWISSLLYGVGAFDPLTFIAVPVLMIFAAAIASFLPARKAVRIDPISSLRQQ